MIPDCVISFNLKLIDDKIQFNKAYICIVSFMYHIKYYDRSKYHMIQH